MERDYRRPYSYKFYSGYEVPFRRYSSSSTTFSERAFSVKTGSSNWCSNRRDARAGSFEGYSNKFVSSVFTVPRRFTLNLKVRNLTLLDLRLYYRYDKPLFSAEYFLSFHFYHSLNYNIFSSCSHSTRNWWRRDLLRWQECTRCQRFWRRDIGPSR